MTDAKEYGRALFLVASEDKVTSQISDDIADVRAALDASPEYTRLLDTPALTKEERLALIDKAFSSIDVRLVNLIKILSEKRSMYLFPKVHDSYCEMYDEYLGILRAEAVTAVPLTEAQTRALEAKIKSLTGKRAVIKNTVEPGILGGMKLRFDGRQLDGSIKGRLDRFEAALRGVIV